MINPHPHLGILNRSPPGTATDERKSQQARKISYFVSRCCNLPVNTANGVCSVAAAKSG